MFLIIQESSNDKISFKTYEKRLKGENVKGQKETEEWPITVFYNNIYIFNTLHTMLKTSLIKRSIYIFKT